MDLVVQMVHKLGSVERVLQQHGNGHGANAAGNRCDVACLWLNFGELHIAAELAVFVVVHAHIDDHCAILYHVGTDEVGFAHGADEDVSTGADLGEVAGAGVANGHGGVAVEEEHCHGLADNVAPADDNAVFARRLDFLVMQHLDYARRSAGQKHAAARHYRADILRMEAGNVLFGRDAANKLV